MPRVWGILTCCCICICCMCMGLWGRDDETRWISNGPKKNCLQSSLTCIPGPTMLGFIWCWGMPTGLPTGTGPEIFVFIVLGCSLSSFFHCSILSECFLMSSSLRASSFFRSEFSSVSKSSGFRADNRNRFCRKKTSIWRGQVEEVHRGLLHLQLNHVVVVPLRVLFGEDVQAMLQEGIESGL